MNTGPPRPAVRRQLGGRKKSGKLRPRLREPCMEPGSPPPHPALPASRKGKACLGFVPVVLPALAQATK